MKPAQTEGVYTHEQLTTFSYKMGCLKVSTDFFRANESLAHSKTYANEMVQLFLMKGNYYKVGKKY